MTTPKAPPSVSYSFVMRLTYPNRIGMFAKLTQTIGRQGGDLGAVDIVNPDAKRMTRDITVPSTVRQNELDCRVPLARPPCTTSNRTPRKN